MLDHMTRRTVARIAALVVGLGLGAASMASTPVVATAAPTRPPSHVITMDPAGTPIIRD
jgi:hypothetical protein